VDCARPGGNPVGYPRASVYKVFTACIDKSFLSVINQEVASLHHHEILIELVNGISRNRISGTAPKRQLACISIV
jgi:hypothetical protein